MRRIDLPAHLVGTKCILCAAGGVHVSARFLDREGGPVCEGHFVSLLRLEKILLTEAHGQAPAYVRNRRKGAAGGRAAAASKRRRREGLPA